MAAVGVGSHGSCSSWRVGLGVPLRPGGEVRTRLTEHCFSQWEPGRHQQRCSPRMLGPCEGPRDLARQRWAVRHSDPSKCRETLLLTEWTSRRRCSAALRLPCAPPVRRDPHATLQVCTPAPRICWPWSCCACQHTSAHHLLRLVLKGECMQACIKRTWWRCCGASLHLPCAPPVRCDLRATLQVCAPCFGTLQGFSPSDACLQSTIIRLFACCGVAVLPNSWGLFSQHADERIHHMQACHLLVSGHGGAAAAHPCACHARRLCDTACTPLCRCAMHVS